MKNITLIIALITLTIILVSCAYKYPVKTSIDEYKPSPQPRGDKKIDAQKSAELIEPVTAQAISLKTKDDKTIFGKYYKADANATGSNSNVAVTLLACVMLTTHVLVPLHAPLHPANVDPDVALAVNVTEVPEL